MSKSLRQKEALPFISNISCENSRHVRRPTWLVKFDIQKRLYRYYVQLMFWSTVFFSFYSVLSLLLEKDNFQKKALHSDYVRTELKSRSIRVTLWSPRALRADTIPPSIVFAFDMPDTSKQHWSLSLNSWMIN